MAFDAYVKIDGIDGESTDEGHSGHIQIDSFSFGATQQGGAATSQTTGQTGSRVDVQEFSITKVMETSTPNLFRYCCSGKHIPSIVVEICGATDSKQTFMKYKLTDSVVSAYSVSGAGGSRPSEVVQFRFGKVELAYTPYKNDGSAGEDVTSGWNLMTNKAV